MSIAILGADLPYGRTLSAYLTEAGESVVNVPIAGITEDRNPKKALSYFLTNKAIKTWVNASYDAYYPILRDEESSSRAAISLAVLSTCQRAGLNYVLLSHHSVFRLNDVAVNKSGTRIPFTVRTPPVVGCHSVAVDCLHTAECELFHATSSLNARMRRQTHVKFRAYMLRLGPLISPRAMSNLQQECTLSAYLSQIRNNSIFLCYGKEAILTPLHTSVANSRIHWLLQKPSRLPQGIYHLGSADSVSVGDLHNYATQRFGVKSRLCDVFDSIAGRTSTLVEFVGNTALDCSHWDTSVVPVEVRLPNWRHMVDLAADGRQLHQAVI